MKRIISITMLSVLVAWTIVPAFAATAHVCSMQCCRRSVRHTHSHCGGMGETTSASRNDSEIKAVTPQCPARCLAKAHRTTNGLPWRVVIGIPLDLRVCKKTLATPQSSEPKLLTRAGRSPPAVGRA
jgi:hypothetical protein